MPSQGDLPQEFLPEHSVGSRASSQVQLVAMAGVTLPPCLWEQGHSCLMKMKPFRTTSPSPSSPLKTLGRQWAEQDPPRRVGVPPTASAWRSSCSELSQPRAGEGKVAGSSPSMGPRVSTAPPGFPQRPGACPGNTCREGTEQGTAAPGLGTALLLGASTAPAQHPGRNQGSASPVTPAPLGSFPSCSSSLH